MRKFAAPAERMLRRGGVGSVLFASVARSVHTIRAIRSAPSRRRSSARRQRHAEEALAAGAQEAPGSTATPCSSSRRRAKGSALHAGGERHPQVHLRRAASARRNRRRGRRPTAASRRWRKVSTFCGSQLSCERSAATAGVLHGERHAGVGEGLHPLQRADQLGVAHRPADAPAGHVVGLGERVELDGHLARPRDLEDRRRAVAVVRDLAVGVVVREDRCRCSRQNATARSRYSRGAQAAVGLFG